MNFVKLPELSPAFKEVLILLVGLVVIGLLLLAFARRAQEHPTISTSGRRRSRKQRPEKELVSITEQEDGRQKRKFRRRRKSHRPRNPSLAETGGLPPDRSGDVDQD